LKDAEIELGKKFKVIQKLPENVIRHLNLG
jgi:hypothetical protein